MFEVIKKSDFQQLCDAVATRDDDFKEIIKRFGYPPFWSRPNTFESVVHIILEQQVSLASALSALNKLRDKIIEVTPENFLLLTDEELKACYFSRQKIRYARDLAHKIVSGELLLSALELKLDDEIRATLTKIKGIGNWTVDIYLVFILHRANVFPPGDLASVNALKQIKKLNQLVGLEVLAESISHLEPYKTIATMLLWHFYLETRKPANRPEKQKAS